MGKVLVTESYLSAIASAIRSKAGTQQTFTPAQMASAIMGISTGVDVSDTTAVAADVRTGKYFYTSAGVKTQGTVATYNGGHHTSRYAVTLTLQTSYGAEYFNSADVYQINSTHVDEYDYYDDITLLGSFTSANDSITVLVSEDTVCIYVDLDTSGMGIGYGTVATTGNITQLSWSDAPSPPYPVGYVTFYFTAAGSGTILIPNIDWDND